MISLALRGAALTGVAALLVIDANALALWGVVVTSTAGLIAQILRHRAEERRAERDHRFAVEDRRAIACGLAEVGAKADAAYEVGARGLDAANNVNEKILSVTKAALARDRASAEIAHIDIT